jgi:hypothetical protein
MAGYSTRLDSENIYGSDNIKKWADLNNNQHEDEIDSRIDWAINLAYSTVNARLKNGPYATPFVSEGSGVDPNIINLSARFVGMLLYDGRNLVDTDEYDQLAPHRKQIRAMIADIHGGRVKLIHTDKVVRFPQSIRF